jgi:hypothetical protein
VIRRPEEEPLAALRVLPPRCGTGASSSYLLGDKLSAAPVVIFTVFVDESADMLPTFLAQNLMGVFLNFPVRLQ